MGADSSAENTQNVSAQAQKFSVSMKKGFLGRISISTFTEPPGPTVPPALVCLIFVRGANHHGSFSSFKVLCCN
jgi:hypothetical protein